MLQLRTIGNDKENVVNRRQKSKTGVVSCLIKGDMQQLI